MQKWDWWLTTLFVLLEGATGSVHALDAEKFEALEQRLAALERKLSADQRHPSTEPLATAPGSGGSESQEIEDLHKKINIVERKLEINEETTAEHAKQLPKWEPKKLRNYYVDPRSVGTKRELDPPSYARTLSKTEWPALKDLTWLDVGLDYRMRYEYRDGDLRRSIGVLDEPILTRTRFYLRVHDIIDPFRFHAEYEDARRFNSQFPEDNRDFNRHELIQAAGELYFKDTFGPDRPLRLQYGRLTMEYLDRRLIALNQWRNTTNNFQGFRVLIGQDSNDWQIDFLGLQPIARDVEKFDDIEDGNPWFYGAIASWRRWSDVITVQPYYLGLRRVVNGIDRRIETLGLRGYGIIGASGFDYDFDYVYQFGRVGSLDHEALMLTTEVGYTFNQDWKPRVSGFIGYVTGDEDPNDDQNERFDRLFGFARPWSANDYFAPENVIAPKLRVDAQPHPNIRLDAGYSAYWLASDTDSFLVGSSGGQNLRDPMGESGSFLGHEFDIRARFKLPYVDTILGYAFFNPGEFVRNTSRNADTNFFYIEISPRLFL